MNKKFKNLSKCYQAQGITLGTKQYILKRAEMMPNQEMLNTFKQIHSLPVMIFQTMIAKNQTQSDSYIDMDLNRANPVNYHILDKFANTASNSNANLVNSEMNRALENPYKDSPRQNSSNFNSNEEFNNILSVLNALKSVYLNSASNSKERNADRIRKFKILNNFFLKDGNEWLIDPTGYLVFNNLHTGVKFSRYIDYFLKYPNEIVKNTPMPIYFEELFLTKILHQKDLAPLVEIDAKKQETKRNSTSLPQFQTQINFLENYISIKRKQIRLQNENFRLLTKLQNSITQQSFISSRTRGQKKLRSVHNPRKLDQNQREGWLKIAKNLKKIENGQSLSNTISNKLKNYQNLKNFKISNDEVSKKRIIELNRLARRLDQKLAQMENSFLAKSSKLIDNHQ